jgi:hypothetical protein
MERRTYPQSPLRRTLRAAIFEGGVSELWTALSTGAVLTAWGLYLESGTFAIACLQAIGTGAQVLHGPAGFFTAWLGRRRVAIFALSAARLVWLPLALAPLAGLGPSLLQPLLFLVVTCSAVLQVLGSNAWSVWMGDVVPTRFRGRFFGARNAFATGGSAAASLACAVLLDASSTLRSVALPILASLLAASGIWSAVLLARQTDRVTDPVAPSIDGYRKVLADPTARAVLGYQFAWGVAIAPGAAFFSLHILEGLGGTFAILALHAVGMATVRVLTVPFWGRVVDRFGARPVLVLCSMGIGTTPLLWIACGPSFFWPLIVDACVAGFLWGGHAIASFDLPLELAPRPLRSYFLALFAMALGVGFVASSLLSGWLATVLPALLETHPSIHLSNLEVLFLGSSLARITGGLVATRIPRRDTAHTRVVLRHALRLRADRSEG